MIWKYFMTKEKVNLIRKISREIQKLELLKAKMEKLKDETESEIDSISQKLKKLYALKTKYEEVESGLDSYFTPSKTNDENGQH